MKDIIEPNETNENKTVDFTLCDDRPITLFVPNGINRATIFNNPQKEFTINAVLVYLGVVKKYVLHFTEETKSQSFPILSQFTGYASLTLISKDLKEDTTLTIQFDFYNWELNDSTSLLK